MWRLLILVAIQTLFLSGGQVLLKIAMSKLPRFAFSKAYLFAVLTDWWLLGSGICIGIAAIMWLYILKYFPLSQAYPLTAMAYIFGMIAAIMVFGETVTIGKWIGVALIIAGSILVIRM